MRFRERVGSNDAAYVSDRRTLAKLAVCPHATKYAIIGIYRRPNIRLLTLTDGTRQADTTTATELLLTGMFYEPIGFALTKPTHADAL